MYKMYVLYFTAHQYPPKMRMLIYSLLDGNVSTRKMAKTVKRIGGITGMAVGDKDIPSRTSVERMQVELGVISDITVAEFLHSANDGVTLAFDATTQSGIHVNAINIHNSTVEHVVALDELPGGTSQDYFDHVIKSIEYLSKLYAEWHNEALDKVKDTMIENIHNVMTDRCVVNQAAVRLINNQWIKKLNHVYCHLHPLDTIATEVKKCLRRLEEDTEARQLSKSGCVIEQIMNAFDKLRYADNIGDPRGFKIHLLKNGLKRGVLQSIRGNRLHLFFQQCEVHHRNKAVFNKYLHSNCPKNIDNLHRIQHDYNMSMASDQLQAAGIISQLVSRPWMCRFYRNAEKSFTFVEALIQVKNVVCSLKDLETTRTVDSIKHDCFQKLLIKESSLWDVDPSSNVMHLVREMARSIRLVLERQYTVHFELTESELTDYAAKTGTARPNNIICEETIGMFSSLQRRAPNASILNISSKLKATKNKTVDTLMGMNENERHFMIENVVKISSVIRKNNRCHVIEMHEEISKRVQVKVAEKQRKKRAQLERKLKEALKSGSDLMKAVECGSEKASMLEKLLKKPKEVLGCYVIHVWYDGNEAADVIWNGKFVRVERDMLVVNYWDKHELEDDGDESAISIFKLGVDYIMDDLLFL